MNNKIKEFAGQAGIHFHKGGTLDAGSDGIARFVLYSDMEKFAELIIQEAASLTLNYKNEIYYNGWLDYRDEIKRHFGIKDAPKT